MNDIALKQGVSAYVSDGLNRWPRCTGSMLPTSLGCRLRRVPQEPGVADEGVPFRDIASVIGPTSERAGRRQVLPRRQPTKMLPSCRQQFKNLAGSP